jgi:large conductance mechanosensitive channel
MATKNVPSVVAAKRETAKVKAELTKARAQAASIKAAQLGGTQAAGFINFVREQGVIGLAVGLAIGAAAGASVKQIVDGLINPIVGFIIGGVDLTKLKWVVVGPKEDGTGGLVLAWGAVISSLITLIATALVIYLIVHVAKLDRVDKKKL